MNTSEIAADPFQLVKVIDFELASAKAGKQSQTMLTEVLQGAALKGYWCRNRNILLKQFMGEIMLFLDLFIAPALGAIEFGYVAGTVFGADW